MNVATAAGNEISTGWTMKTAETSSWTGRKNRIPRWKYEWSGEDERLKKGCLFHNPMDYIQHLVFKRVPLRV